VWLFAAILYVVGVLAAGGNRWIGGPVLLVLLLIALPQEYVTAPEGLRVRAGLTNSGHVESFTATKPAANSSVKSSRC